MTPWGAMTIRASCEAWHARGLVGGWPQKGHEGQERIEEEQGGAQGSGLTFWLEANPKVEKHRGHSLHPPLPPLLSPGPLCRSPVRPLFRHYLSWPSAPGTTVLLAGMLSPRCVSHTKAEKSSPKGTHVTLVFPRLGLPKACL